MPSVISVSLSNIICNLVGPEAFHINEINSPSLISEAPFAGIVITTFLLAISSVYDPSVP